MTALDDKLIPKVKTLLTRLGKSMVLTVKTAGSGNYDPSTGKREGRAETTETVICSPPIDYDLRFIQGDHIRSGDVKIFIPAQGLTIAPAPNMQIAFDSFKWFAVAVKPIYSGTSIAVWEVQARTTV